MAAWVAWALTESAERGDVVVVCGGYHKPQLERLAAELLKEDRANSSPPQAAPSGDVRVGSYLVPFSFKRLDAFQGYASGMPSPAWYEQVWQLGHEQAGEEMLFGAVRHLRGRGQRVSPADAIAASTLAQGLGRLRGHPVLTRVDVLDGLASALVKDALEAPLPWTRRGPLPPRTEPLLAELVSAFSGDRHGALAPDTPQPPLVADALAALERCGLHADREPRPALVKLTTPQGAEQSAALHRLRVLGISGFAMTRGPSLARSRTELSESWTLERRLETDAALIEAAIHGATLESAATSFLEQRLSQAPDVIGVAAALYDAATCGLQALSGRALREVERRIAVEPSFGLLGGAIERLLALRRGDAVLGPGGKLALSGVLSACFERGLWLLEGVRGASAPLDEQQVGAVCALRDLARLPAAELPLDRVRARAVCERRARDAEAPPALRGACLGFLWSHERSDERAAAEAAAVAAARALARPETFGDFLGGLFALARDEVVRARELLGAIDSVLDGFGRESFLIALPALRLAFAYFPPRERLSIAEGVLALHGTPAADPMALVRPGVEAALYRRGAALDGAAVALALDYGLEDDLDGPRPPEGAP
jgi:hypothetical protein